MLGAKKQRERRRASGMRAVCYWGLSTVAEDGTKCSIAMLQCGCCHGQAWAALDTGQPALRRLMRAGMCSHVSSDS